MMRQNPPALLPLPNEGASPSATSEDASSRRSCVICRDRVERDGVIRVVRSPGGNLALDWKGKLPGRGAHLCWRLACIRHRNLAARLGRALEAPVEFPEEGWPEGAIRRHVSAKVVERLGLLVRSGGARPGHDSALRAVSSGWATFLVVASDASEGTLSRAGVGAEKDEIPLYRLPLDRDQMGAAMGRSPVVIIAVGRGSLPARLQKELQTWRDFL